MELGQDVEIVTIRAGRLMPKRVRLNSFSDVPSPLCIAVGFRAERAKAKPLAVLIEEPRKAAQTFA